VIQLTYCTVLFTVHVLYNRLFLQLITYLWTGLYAVILYIHEWAVPAANYIFMDWSIAVSYTVYP
jgi:hypothetical protein